jgi:hypothetical protein
VSDQGTHPSPVPASRYDRDRVPILVAEPGAIQTEPAEIADHDPGTIARPDRDQNDHDRVIGEKIASATLYPG